MRRPLLPRPNFRHRLTAFVRRFRNARCSAVAAAGLAWVIGLGLASPAAAQVCTGAAPVTCTVTNGASLREAAQTILLAPGANYIVNITSSFTMDGQPLPVRVDAGFALTINGNNHTINGAGLYRAFFIWSGIVNIHDLTIHNARAAGGNGFAAGGGGMGAGAGLFVNTGAFVTLTNVGLTNGAAVGGTGASAVFNTRGGGGGMGGTGGGGVPGGFHGGGGGLYGAGGSGYSGRGAGGGGGIVGSGGSADSAISGGGGGGGITGAGGGPEQAGSSIGGGGGGGATNGAGAAGAGAGNASLSGGGGGGIIGQAGSDGLADGSGGAGGFGGGGGGVTAGTGGAGGPGGGGGGGSLTGGNGNDFGGGGAGSAQGGNGGFGGGGAAWMGHGGFGGGGGAGGQGGEFGGDGANAAGGGGAALGGAIFVRDGGTLTINGTIIGGGAVTPGSGGTGAQPGKAHGTGLFLHGASTVSVEAGVIGDGIAGTGSLTKTGAGALVLSGAHSYTGATTVSGGTLVVDGTQTGSTITIQNGASLGVVGTVGTVVVENGGTWAGTGKAAHVTVQTGGTVTPGASPGILHAGTVTFAAGATLAIELTGLVAGNDYDQLAAATVAINNATLSVTLGFTPSIGDVFAIVQNATGTFAGLPQGTRLIVGPHLLAINYAGGDGNDVTLTVVQNFPPTATGLADLAIARETNTSVPFTVADEYTPPGALLVTAVSSNDALVPDATLIVGGSGANRTLPIAPLSGQSGQNTITVTVADDLVPTTYNFVLTVSAPPTIAGPANATIARDTSTTVDVTVGDDFTAAGTLSVSATSSNQTLVPDANLVPDGADANRTLQITPAAGQSGQSTITVTVDDGLATTQASFVLTVSAPPTTTGPTNTTIARDSSTTVNLTVGDDFTALDTLVVSATSNQTLVPNASLIPDGSDANRTLPITPATGQSGQTTIIVTVDDRLATAQTTFVLTVSAPPTITGPANTTIARDTSTIVTLTVGDDFTALGALVVSATSSNQTLVPNANLIPGGTLAARTLQITPATGQSGQTTITATVNDGLASTQASFVLTVDARPTVTGLVNTTIGFGSAGPTLPSPSATTSPRRAR